MNRCDECKWWIRLGPQAPIGDCRINPPMGALLPTEQGPMPCGFFPRSAPDHFCSKWEKGIAFASALPRK